MFWACASCALASSSLTTTFAVTNDNSYAAAIEFSVTLPSYTSSSTTAGSGQTFSLTSMLLPSPPGVALFRGPFASEISLSLVPVVVDESRLVGTFAQLVSAVSGSQVNLTTFGSGNGVSVTLSMSSSLMIYEIVLAPQSQIQLFAQVGALSGTVLVIVRLLMNQLERLFPSRRRSKAANGSSAALAETPRSSRMDLNVVEAEMTSTPTASPKPKKKKSRRKHQQREEEEGAQALPKETPTANGDA